MGFGLRGVCGSVRVSESERKRLARRGHIFLLIPSRVPTRPIIGSDGRWGCC